MHPWRDRWTVRGAERLHFLVAEGEGELVPLVYRGGALSDGTDLRDDLPHLAPRPVVVAGQRGLGRSSAPPGGYGFADQVSDFAAIVDQAKLGRCALMAYSRGVPVVLGWALEHAPQVAGLILLDAPPVFPKPSDAWVQDAHAARPDVPMNVLEAMAREARRVDLWDRIGGLACPVLVIAGGSAGAHLGPEDVRRYRRVLSTAEVRVFEDADHRVFAPDPERFWNAVTGFLQRLD